MKFFWFFNAFPELRINRKKSKISPKNSELEMARFSRKSQKIKKIKIFEIFLENFWFFNEFPEFRINEKYRKPASPKNGKFARFSRKLVHVFQGKKKAGFKKEMKLDL